MSIIPFGKHKGRDVLDVIQTDPQYLQWLQAQPWFRDGHPTLYQIVINYGAEPSETPEHNALQVLFLDDGFCKAFLELNSWASVRNIKKTFEERGVDVHLSSTIEAQSCGRWEFINEHNDRWPRHKEIIPAHWEQSKDDHGRYLDGPRASIEIKPTIGDDYPAVLRQMRANHSNTLFLEQYTGIGATLDQFIKFFKLANINVVFRHEIGF
jgi:uncharacterized protein (DUF3820 family)